MSDLIVRTNIRDFTVDLRALGDRITKRVARNAVAAAARVILPIARRRAPSLKNPKEKRRVPGTLKAGIYVQRVKRIDGGLSAGISVRSPRSARFTKRFGLQFPFYWRFLEGGWIPRGPGRRLKGGDRRKREQRSASTGGRRQFPFLAPALQEGGPAALRKFEEIMAKGIAREQAKQGRSDV
jgi:hypothetical protein